MIFTSDLIFPIKDNRWRIYFILSLITGVSRSFKHNEIRVHFQIFSLTLIHIIHIYTYSFHSLL